MFLIQNQHHLHWVCNSSVVAIHEEHNKIQEWNVVNTDRKDEGQRQRLVSKIWRDLAPVVQRVAGLWVTGKTYYFLSN